MCDSQPVWPTKVTDRWQGVAKGPRARTCVSSCVNRGPIWDSNSPTSGHWRPKPAFVSHRNNCFSTTMNNLSVPGSNPCPPAFGVPSSESLCQASAGRNAVLTYFRGAGTWRDWRPPRTRASGATRAPGGVKVYNPLLTVPAVLRLSLCRPGDWHITGLVEGHKNNAGRCMGGSACDWRIEPRERE